VSSSRDTAYWMNRLSNGRPVADERLVCTDLKTRLICGAALCGIVAEGLMQARGTGAANTSG
jgi:hypothetical protein